MKIKNVISLCLIAALLAPSANAAAHDDFIPPTAARVHYTQPYPNRCFYGISDFNTVSNKYDPAYYIKNSAALPELRLTGNTEGMTKYKDKVLKFEYPDQNVSCYAAVSLQGNSSLNFAKKSYSVKLYDDKDTDIERKVQFGGWKETENYLLKANWIDYTNARNIVAGRLYRRLPNSTLPNGTYGIPDGFPVRLYINNNYRGIYTVVQPKKKKLFGLTDKDAVNGARLYSAEVKEGSAVFKNSSAEDNCWECKFPADHFDKTALNRLTEFISSCTYEEFKSYIGRYMDIDSLLNYMVFSEITLNADGWQKNYNIVTYDGKLWYIRPYDLDCTFGLDFAGNINKESYTDSMDDWINTTRLWLCVKVCFPRELYQRYLEVRSNQLTEDAVINEFSKFINTIGKDNYRSENTVWNRHDSIEECLEQIREFVKIRYEFLDVYMKNKYDHPSYITAYPTTNID